MEEQQARTCLRMTKGLAWPSGRGESGKEVVKRLSLHLLGGNLAVGAGGGSQGEAEAAEGLLFSVWLQPGQHKSTSDWAAKVGPITGAWLDVKEPSISIIREQRGAKKDSASSFPAPWTSLCSPRIVPGLIQALAANTDCLSLRTANRREKS